VANQGTKAVGEGPLVSAVIHVRDGLTYLPDAIDSVASQAVSGLEIVVVDEGSVDGTAEWLRARAKAEPRLVLLRASGEGPSAARNRGIAAARAPLIAFLEAGNAWLPGKLVPQLACHAADPELVFSFGDYLQLEPSGQHYTTCFEHCPAFRQVARAPTEGGSAYRRLRRARERLLAERIVGISTVVARRDALQFAGGFKEGLGSAADWDLWLRLASTGPVAFTPALGARCMTRNSDRAGSEARVRVACMRQMLAAHAPQIAQDSGGAGAIRRARANLLRAEAELAKLEGRHRTAVAAEFGALIRAPSFQLGRSIAAGLLRAATRAPWR
jgi:glycosyltransferase involved in cell wall biosynthesis